MIYSLLATGLFICFLLVLSLRRKNQLLSAELVSQNTELTRLSEDVHTMCSTSHGLGNRIIEIEKSLSLLRQQQTSQQARTPNQVAYTQAKKLISLGASLDEIQKTCGLSKSEARLVAMSVENKQS